MFIRMLAGAQRLVKSPKLSSMPTFGDRLRHERESRGRTIEEISAISGIQQALLEALERDEFDALPGRAFGKLYLRAYAEILGFDPRPLIEVYDKENQAQPSTPAEPVRTKQGPAAEAIARWRQSRNPRTVAASLSTSTAEIPPEPAQEPEAEEVLEPEPLPAVLAPGADLPPPEGEPLPQFESIPPPRLPSTSLRPPWWGIVAVVGLAFTAYLFFFRGSPAPPSPPASPAPASHPAIVPDPAPIKVEAPPAPVKPAPQPPAGTPTVTESGVGHRVVSSRLEGEGEPFRVGDVAWFQTRVVGGRGAVIRHVWIYEGRAQQSIRLRVGADDWRTHSNKTLLKPGAWTVEARDADGRVLASAALTCAPR